MKHTIYMKSGNRLVLSGIKNIKISYKGNEITAINIELSFIGRWLNFGERLFVASIDMYQIEAITKG